MKRFLRMEAITTFPDKKVQGGALYIAVLISIIIGIMLSLFLLMARYNQRTVVIYNQKSQLSENLNSAFEISKSKYFNGNVNSQWQKNLFSDDSTRITKLQWGAYTVVTAETKNRHERLQQACLFGTFMPADTALIIADNGRPVGLCGKIRFSANVFLPKAGIKPAFIEGQSYQPSPANSAFIKSISGNIPELSAEMKSTLLNMLQKKPESNDSVVGNINPVESGSFFQRTIVHQLPAGKLSNIKLKNNIKLLCVGDLEVDSTCKFDNVLIVCRKVRFKEGFSGSVHVIASDSIITGSNCTFGFPSSFVLAGQDNNVLLKSILFGEKNYFAGGIVAFSENPTIQTKMFVQLGSSCKTLGLIYCSDYVNAAGTVNATIIAKSLLLKTPSAVYENHLLDCELDPRKYSAVLAVPLLFSNNNKLKLAKVL